ncbi:MAG: hypothetical protein AB7G11_00960 [Phycisphaerales bacterium]
MFATDRDLLVLEPNLFRDAGWVGQRLLVGAGSLSGTLLTLTSGDFQAVGVTAGNVLLYDATPCEVISVTAGNKANISLIRSDPAGAAIPPPALGAKAVVVTTFRPQIALAHTQVLRMLGIEPTDAAAPGVVTESSIVNQRTLWLATALSALHLIYSGASALAPTSSPLSERAEMYRRLFAEERKLAAARIDTDADGIADATRRMNVIQLMRG